MFKYFKNFFSQVDDVSSMASLENVKTNLPSDTQYATLSLARVVQPKSTTLSTEAQQSISAMDLAGNELTPAAVCYLAHNGTTIKLIRGHEELFSAPMADIRSLYRFHRGGFGLKFANGLGIALATPTPIKTDSTMNVRTIHGVTDMTGGWLKELEPFGVTVFD